MSEHIIEKEELANYTIIPAEEDKTAFWKEKLQYAVRLGNEFKSKTSITFNTSEGERTVFTTVWSLTDNYLTLKAGRLIPLNSVINVHY
ncbi:hypothetical protein [Niabella ginsengisoli]|uniref:Uncharacterized protein n=1 Tax=Niabella ginsengisoli TaxID=522298 RepID=A0ABS9SPK1_9BACT|nr:hypothetical protein [Niabella ginsengisoli]MCH5600282.1 hypothetical protein [Niabella ginsengisoli]